MHPDRLSFSRRDFLATTTTAAVGAVVAAASPSWLFAGTPTTPLTFPKGFWWGTATAAYQVEGAVKEDGRGESIWDRFSHTPGKTKNGDTGDIADDHYHRYKEDVAIMRELNIKSCRFSIAWPRIQPTGSGKPNDKGLDFYKRLVDTLLEAKIRPFPTLYHWDLPQALEEAGGWPNRDTAKHFADYADLVSRSLGDRLHSYMIFNEPWVFNTLGYLLGTHAPGRTDINAYLHSIHVTNLAQAMAFRAIKANQPKAPIGSAFSMSAMDPASNSAADKEAAERGHRYNNVLFLQPAIFGTYPDAFVGVTPEMMGVQPGDMEKVKAPLDFFGINNYFRFMASAATPRDVLLDPFKKLLPVNLELGGPTGPKTDMGWEVYPHGLYEIVMRITKDYKRPVIEITENGCAYGDAPNQGGEDNDQRRIDFYRGYLTELHKAIKDGADVRGYHAWSLLDNFEWAEGYSKRFGLVYVDYPTQKRTVKDSGRWYAKVAAANALPAARAAAATR